MINGYVNLSERWIRSIYESKWKEIRIKNWYIDTSIMIITFLIEFGLFSLFLRFLRSFYDALLYNI